MNIKQNQKFKSTHQAIVDAVLELLSQKDIKQITVAEICRAAHINRSSFYLHFDNVYDVVEKTAEEIASEISREMPPPSAKPDMRGITVLFEHVRRHSEFYSVCLKQGLPLDIQRRFFGHELPPAAGAERDVPVEIQYHHAIFTAGLDALLLRWLERGCAETTQQLYDILAREFGFGRDGF